LIEKTLAALDIAEVGLLATVVALFRPSLSIPSKALEHPAD
jgi:hypothetical protein